jgi:hypothetical protein
MLLHVTSAAIACCLAVSFTSLHTSFATAASSHAVTFMNDAPDSQPRLRVGQVVEIKELSQWRGGVVKNIRGQAFLVMYDGWDQPFHWEWVTRDRIRMPGSNDPGPDPFSQIGEKLNNQTADVALRAFEKKLQARPQPQGEPSPSDDASDARRRLVGIDEVRGVRCTQRALPDR